jgi:hypothetical protein
MNKYTILLAVFVIVGLTGSARASTVLFADTFNRPDNTDLNASTAGKSGTLGALDWDVTNSGGIPAINTDRLQLGETGAGGGFSLVWTDHNFTDNIITTGGEFTVSVDVFSLGSSGDTRFNGFAVGNSLADLTGWSTSSPTLFTSDFFFGYDPTGITEVKIFLGGTEAYQQTIDLSAGGTLSARFYGFSDFNSGTTVNYEAFINGGLPVATGNFTWSGTNENYINLYSNYTDDNARLDNFEVIAVPEPSSLAMLCMSSVGLYLLRRRSRA